MEKDTLAYDPLGGRAVVRTSQILCLVARTIRRNAPSIGVSRAGDEVITSSLGDGAEVAQGRSSMGFILSDFPIHPNGTNCVSRSWIWHPNEEAKCG